MQTAAQEEKKSMAESKNDESSHASNNAEMETSEECRPPLPKKQRKRAELFLLAVRAD